MRLLNAAFAGLVAASSIATASADWPFSNSVHEGIWHPSIKGFASFLADVTDAPTLLSTSAPDSSTMRDVGLGLLRNVVAWSEKQLAGKNVQRSEVSNEYPYWRFLPDYITNALPNGQAVSWTAPCFQKSSATMTPNADGKSWTFTLDLQEPSSLLCSDMYLFGTVEGIKVESFMAAGTHSIQWTPKADVRPAQLYDIQSQGIRICRFVEPDLTLIADILDTALLFEPMGTMTPSKEAEARNVDFITKYTDHFFMKNRTAGPVPIDSSLINSGDFIGIIRLDGLDPMLSWAMGAATGHTTIAIRDPADGQLYIHESTTNGNYWPTNGIQKTPYDTWIKQAQSAGYNMVWAPLSPDSRAKFNTTAAIEFFQTVEGVDYGYYNMLMAWIDTPQENYPCVPPDFSMCLTWQHIELLFGVMDQLAPSIFDLLFGQTLNHRVGTTGLRAPELLQYAAVNKTMQLAVLPTIPEDDSWVYNTKRYNESVVAPSMVCCVFVCNMWKHGGLFDDLDREINCGEFTNGDDYMSTLLDGKFERPQQCVTADAENQLCQLNGDYTLNFLGYASRTPTIHMAEKCPSVAPDYVKPVGC